MTACFFGDARRPRRCPYAAVCGAILLVFAASADAADFRVPFDAGPVSWAADGRLARDAVAAHDRSVRGPAESGIETIRITAADAPRRGLSFVHAIPRSPVFSEVRAEVTLRATGSRLRLALRLECPDVVDPVTKRPVVFDFAGDVYEQHGQWQTLRCACEDARIQERLAILRSTLRKDGATGPMSFDRLTARAVVLKCDVPAAGDALQVDDLSFGPLADLGAVSRPPIVDAPAERGESPADLSNGQFRVGGRPFVPRLLPYRGEAIDVIRSAGVNVAWVGDAVTPDVRAAIREADIWLTTAPPATADVHMAGLSSSPAAMGVETRDVLFWNLTTDASGRNFDAVAGIAESVRRADRLYSRPRPIHSDVSDNELKFSRRLDVVGSRLACPGAATSPRDYFAELSRRRRLMVADKPSLAWCVTELPPTGGPGAAPPPVVEPEQIWLQAELALAAGYQGIQYWTQTPLAVEDVERRAAMTLLNRRLDVMREWIAGGRLDGVYPVRVADGGAERYHPTIFAATYWCERGQLVLLVTADEDGHVAPAPMAASDLRITVRGGTELSNAYIVSEVDVHALESRRGPGGIEIDLPRFDQSAILLLTPFNEVVAEMRRHVALDRERIVEAWIDLASAKLERVTNSHAAIDAAAPQPLRGGDSQLAEARLQVDRARDAAAAGSHREARRRARLALQMLRILQRAHLQNALMRLSGPGATIGSLAFSSLPEHWRTLQALGRSEDRGIVLQTGFDSKEGMVIDGWRSLPGFGPESAAELAPAADGEGLCLRLAAADDPRGGDAKAVRASVLSPELHANAGELALVKLRVRGMSTKKPGTLRVSDSVAGTEKGLKVTVSPETWREVELIRRVVDGRPFRLRLDLIGSGVVCVDAVTVRAFAEADEVPEVAAEEPPRRNPLSRFPRLPRWWGGERIDEPQLPTEETDTAEAVAPEP